MGPGTSELQVTMHYIDSRDVDFFNKPELHNDAQTLVDASFTYSIDEFYGSIFGHNLTDEDGYQIGFDVAGLWSYAAPRPPRTWGVEVGWRFGEE
jgi:iron complex outermembrane receptor protein